MQIVRLVDRVGADSLISNALFEDSIIVGPAVVTFMDTVSLDDCRFDAPPEVLFIDIGAEPRAVVGIIGIRQTTFRNCEFRNVGIIGPTAVIELLRASLQPSQQQQANSPSPIPVEAPAVATSVAGPEAQQP